MAPRTRLACVFALLAVGCGGGQTRGNPFERAWSDESGTELAAFVARWRVPAPREAPPLAVGTIEGRALVGGVMGAPAWRVDVPVEGQPLLAGRVVVAMAEGRLVAIDAVRGQRLWALPALGQLRGASDDGTTTLVSIDSLSGRRSIVLAVARNGTVVRQIVEEERVGAPVVVDEFAFLPVGGRAVIVFDLINGVEAARVIATVPLARAHLAEDALYLGDEEMVRFDATVVEARRGRAARLHPPQRLLPGNPRWWTAPEGGERPRAFVLAQPSKEGIGVAAYVAGPFVVGLRSGDGATAWVRRAPSAYIAGRATNGGFMLCRADGAIVVLDDRGVELARASLGTPIDRCDTTVGRLAPSPSSAVSPLPEQMTEALREPMPERLDVQLLLVDDLARLDTPQARAALDAIASAPGVANDSVEMAHARAALREHARFRRATAVPRTPR